MMYLFLIVQGALVGHLVGHIYSGKASQSTPVSTRNLTAMAMILINAVTVTGYHLAVTNTEMSSVHVMGILLIAALSAAVMGITVAFFVTKRYIAMAKYAAGLLQENANVYANFSKLSSDIYHKDASGKPKVLKEEG